MALLPVEAWAQPYAFVTSAAGNSIAVVDVAQDVSVGSFPLGGLPSGGMLVGNYLFVAQTQANSLAKIDLVFGNTTQIPAGNMPVGVAVNPWFVFVTNPGDDTVSVINAWSGNPGIVLTKPVGDSPFAVVGGLPMLYVANWGEGTVTVIDTFTSGMPVVGTIPVGNTPAGLLQDFVGGRLYVANFVDDTVSVVNTATLSVTATIPVCARPRGLAGARGHVYVACFGDGQIDVIDPATNQVVLEAPSGGVNPLDLRADPSGQRLYVVHMQVGKSITVLDAATLSPLSAIEASPGPVTVAGFGNVIPPPGTWKRIVGRGDGPALSARRPLGAERSLLPRRQPHGAAGEVVAHDSYFDPDDWAIHVLIGEQTATQEVTGGADDPFWRRMIDAPSTYVEADHEFTAAQYSPAIQGPVAEISARWFVGMLSGVGTFENFVVFQGGRAFKGPGWVVSGAAWQDSGKLYFGLGADDFHDGTGGIPDFSAFGQPLTFGYHRSSGGGTHGIDDFEVRVLTAEPGAGILRFTSTFAAVQAGERFTATVERVGGLAGHVSVDVAVQCGDIYPPFVRLDWANSDGTPQPFSATCPGYLYAIRINDALLRNPGGGASLDPLGRRLVLFVTPINWPPALSAMLTTLLSGMSPVWLLALSGPAAFLAVGRRSKRQAGPGRAPRVWPASSPARKP